jgi:tetratricopeptide (TPR) repeat protein
MRLLSKLFGTQRTATVPIPRTQGTPVRSGDEEFVHAAPLAPSRRRLLWMDPAALNLLVNSFTVIHEGSQLIEVQYSEHDIQWAKRVNEYAVRAEQAGRASQFQQAIELYKAALRLAPGCDLYLMSVGCCYANLGDLRRGLNYLERANEISPGQKRITQNLQGIRHAAALARR